MKQVRILKIVVASPSDVQAERDMIPAIVDELNKGIADEQGRSNIEILHVCPDLRLKDIRGVLRCTTETVLKRKLPSLIDA